MDGIRGTPLYAREKGFVRAGQAAYMLVPPVEPLQLGAYGGAQGAVFVAINRRLSLWRFDRVPVSSPVKRFFEVLVVAAIVCAFTFGFSYAFGSCAPRPSADAAEPYLDDLVSFYCSADEFNELGQCGGPVEYNDCPRLFAASAASLFMVSSESAIKQLFHSTKPFSVANLALFYATYTLLSCMTYGADKTRL